MKFTFSKTFPNTGTVFSGLSAASMYLKRKGYSLGTMDVPNPIAVVKGKWRIGKWNNLLKVEREAVDGIMESDNFRDGDVIVRMKKGL